MFKKKIDQSGNKDERESRKVCDKLKENSGRCARGWFAAPRQILSKERCPSCDPGWDDHIHEQCSQCDRDQIPRSSMDIQGFKCRLIRCSKYNEINDL